MTASSLLVRLLLAAALILNGIGSAVAGVRMLGATQAMPATIATHHAAAAPAPSHDGCHEQVTAPDVEAPSGHAHDGADCCDAGQCACHCMQQAQGVSAPPVLATVPFAQSTTARGTHSAHESPPHPHLIRPPIRPAA